MRKIFLAAVISFSLAGCSPTVSESVSEGKMTSAKMAEVIQKFDEDAEVKENSIIFELKDRELMLVFDNNADRMRIISPIMQSFNVPESLHARMLQANFDAVLDSRYAIANDMVWSVYIHKLSTLAEEDLISGIAQTYSAAETFGTTYTSGAIVFGGGDTNSIHQDLLEQIENAPVKEGQGI